LFWCIPCKKSSLSIKPRILCGEMSLCKKWRLQISITRRDTLWNCCWGTKESQSIIHSTFVELLQRLHKMTRITFCSLTFYRQTRDEIESQTMDIHWNQNVSCCSRFIHSPPHFVDFDRISRGFVICPRHFIILWYLAVEI
jgi:hypothetical protein